MFGQRRLRRRQDDLREFSLVFDDQKPRQSECYGPRVTPFLILV
ncbi:MAG TPA: hypothetical protein VKE51_12995 [Vicinamibacterales bacterium]|nr:hypothetical protein [Vicinamibacterales bacterium]